MSSSPPLPLKISLLALSIAVPPLFAGIENNFSADAAFTENFESLDDFAASQTPSLELEDTTVASAPGDDVTFNFGDVYVDGIDDDGFDKDDDDIEEDILLEDADLITVNYPDEAIRRILRNVADLYGINVVIPDTLIGNTSIKLRDVSWRQVFDIILKPGGFTFVEDGNIVRVVSIAEISQEPMELRTFTIKYARAAEVAASLAPIIGSEGGAVQVDNRSNSLIVRERPSILKQIDNLLKTSTIDQPSLQVMIETKFIELSRNSNPDRKDGLGLNWWGDGAVFGANNDFLRLNGMLDIFNNFGGSALKTAVLKQTDYNMLLTALETTNDASLLANPTVVILNNETAEFHVGKNQPIIEANFDTTTGQFTVGEVEYLPVGVRVQVTPRVNAGADQITLNIHPKISKIIDTLPFKGAGDGLIEYPIEQIRETETSVSIRNGYTLALGGLIQEDDTEKIEKVPCLGDLPLIGRIFQRKAKTLDKVNLVMFITAKTLNPDGSTYHDIVDPRQIAALGVSDADLPGYANGVETPGMAQMSDRERQLLQELQDERNRCYDKLATRDLRAEKFAASNCTAKTDLCKPKRVVKFPGRRQCHEQHYNHYGKRSFR